MSTSKHQIQVKATDQTAGAFNSIKNRAGATGAQISRMMQSAIGAAAGYLSFRAIKGGIDELGMLSDVAQRANISVEDLTKGLKAMEIMGIQQMNLETFSKSLVMMEKNTGRRGLPGFYQTLEELAKIPDIAKRNQEAMRIFSEYGLNFGPLINGAKEGTDALRQVMDMMPGISQAAAEAGDAASDSLNLIWTTFRNQFLEGLGGLMQIVGEDLPGGMRESAALAGDYIVAGIQKGCIKAVQWITNLTLSAFNKIAWLGDAIDNYIRTSDSWGESMRYADGQYDLRAASYNGMVSSLDAITAEIDERYEQRKKDIKGFQAALDRAAQIGVGGGATGAALAGGASGTAAAKMISNALYEAGTAAAVKLTMLGPKTEAVQKKQLKVLEQIEKNTKRDGSAEIEVFEG